jgi:hypothetical protein
MRRVVLAALLGNVLGWGAWQAARLALPQIWELAQPADQLSQMAMLATTAMALAAPPVLIGALCAWLARRAQLWVGLACGLWGLTLIRPAPPAFPIAAGLWYAPTVLVLLSSAMGGWMLDLRAQAAASARPERSEP